MPNKNNSKPKTESCKHVRSITRNSQTNITQACQATKTTNRTHRMTKLMFPFPFPLSFPFPFLFPCLPLSLCLSLSRSLPFCLFPSPVPFPSPFRLLLLLCPSLSRYMTFRAYAKQYAQSPQAPAPWARRKHTTCLISAIHYKCSRVVRPSRTAQGYSAHEPEGT